MDEPRWLVLARADIDVDQSDNIFMARIFSEAAPDEKVDVGKTPWCAAWLGAKLVECGLSGSGSLAAASYLDHGEELSGPVVGCIAVLDHHVGLVNAIDRKAGMIELLGGNQGHSQGRSAVTVARYKIASVKAWRWPIQIARPSQIAAAGSRTMAKGSADVGTGWVTVATGASAIAANPAPPTPPSAATIATEAGHWMTIAKHGEGALVLAQHHLLPMLLIGLGVYLVAGGHLVRAWRAADQALGWNLRRQTS